MEFCVTFKERLQERIRVESELREEKTRLLNVVKEKEGELAKERSEFTDRLQQHEQVIEVSTAFLLVSFQSCKVERKLFWRLVIPLIYQRGDALSRTLQVKNRPVQQNGGRVSLTFYLPAKSVLDPH